MKTIEVHVNRDQSVCKVLVDGEDIVHKMPITKLTLTVDGTGVPKLTLELEPNLVVAKVEGAEVEIK